MVWRPQIRDHWGEEWFREKEKLQITKIRTGSNNLSMRNIEYETHHICKCVPLNLSEFSVDTLQPGAQELQHDQMLLSPVPPCPEDRVNLSVCPCLIFNKNIWEVNMFE